MERNERNLALDVFRGMTVCFMIIVNSPGDWVIAYEPLLHAKWHGFTPTDLVFPSFLFVVGNAMAFVRYKYESRGEGVFWTKTLKRTFIIFLLGYLMYWYPFIQHAEDGSLILRPIAETRILGVLQRIALCYFFASVVIHYGSKTFAFWFSILALIAYWFLAYAFGLPVIAADVGSLREDIVEGRTGFLFRPQDSADLATTIKRYFCSDLYGSLSSRRQDIRNYATERHSWDGVSTITRNVYAQLLEKVTT